MDRPPLPRTRRIVPATKWRDTLIAIGAGIVVLGFVVFAIFALGRQANSSGGMAGIITAKEFVPQAETQITVGQGGVQSRRTAGDYILHVRTSGENGRVYEVHVDPTVYAAERVGERYYFVRPPE